MKFLSGFLDITKVTDFWRYNTDVSRNQEVKNHRFIYFWIFFR